MSVGRERVAYQVFGEGPGNLVFLLWPCLSVDALWENVGHLRVWRLASVVDSTRAVVAVGESDWRQTFDLLDDLVTARAMQWQWPDREADRRWSPHRVRPAIGNCSPSPIDPAEGLTRISTTWPMFSPSKGSRMELMTTTHLQPPGILELPGLSQVIVATGSRQVYIAGQTPLTADGVLIGEGDLRTQAAVVFEHLLTCLRSVDATVADVVRTTLYVVDFGPESLDAIYTAAFEVLGDDLPRATSTLVGAAALFHPGQLFEIDAVAVLD